jgi:predicted dehydrogenase
VSKPLGIGLVGYRFMGKAHSHAYHDLNIFFNLTRPIARRAICGRDEQAVKAAAAKWHWEGYETDYRQLVERPDIDIIDISSPGHSHVEIALAAAAAGKHIICEKPLANTLADAKKMLEAVRKAGVKHMTAFNCRKIPSILLAKKWIDEGLIGEPYLFRGAYLQDWIVDPEFPLVWRLDKSVCGSGALGDLAAHTIDLAHFLVGDIISVNGLMKTIIDERPLAEAMDEGLGAVGGTSGKRGKVLVDDVTMFLAKFANGVVATFEATRFATGNRNASTFEINGSEGGIRWNIERLNEIELYLRSDPPGRQGWRLVQVGDGAEHPYIDHYWPAGHIIGWEHSFIHEIYEFVEAVANDTPVQPDFLDGVKCQAVLEAVEQSAKIGQWVDVEQVQ